MNRHRSQQGFGLLEVVIAASIMALVSGSVVALAMNSIQMSILGANRTDAYQLSQEGVEIVRQLRDTTYIDGLPNSWNTPFDTSCASDSCQIKKDASGVSLVAGSETVNLATGSASTPFTRKITIKPISWYTQDKTSVPNNPTDITVPPLALQVKCVVSWQQQGRTISAESSTILTDWRPVQ